MCKYFIITKKQGNFQFIGNDTEAQEWISKYAINWGKPIREVRKKVWIEENISANPDEDADGSFGYDFYPDETYDDVDVLSERDLPTGKPILEENLPIWDEAVNDWKKELETWVTLKAEYTVEITDYNPVPQSVSPMQIRLALNELGLRQAIETAVASGSQNLKDMWEFATMFERSHPLIETMRLALGLTAEQVDDIFRLAATK